MADPASPSPGPPRGWLHKFGDAFRGVWLAVTTQSSFAVHIPVAVAACLLAAWLGISPVEWCLVALAIGMVLAAEVCNTSIEEIARAMDTGPHPGIRDALDIASGLVLVCVATAIVVGLVILGPRIWPLVV